MKSIQQSNLNLKPIETNLPPQEIEVFEQALKAKTQFKYEASFGISVSSKTIQEYIIRLDSLSTPSLQVLTLKADLYRIMSKYAYLGDHEKQNIEDEIIQLYLFISESEIHSEDDKSSIAKALLQLGCSALYRDKDEDKAIELFKKSTDLDYAKAYTYLGMTYEKSDKLFEKKAVQKAFKHVRMAITCFNQAIVRGHFFAHAKLGNVLISLDEIQGGLKELRKARNEGVFLKEKNDKIYIGCLKAAKSESHSYHYKQLESYDYMKDKYFDFTELDEYRFRISMLEEFKVEMETYFRDSLTPINERKWVFQNLHDQLMMTCSELIYFKRIEAQDQETEIFLDYLQDKVYKIFKFNEVNISYITDSRMKNVMHTLITFYEYIKDFDPDVKEPTKEEIANSFMPPIQEIKKTAKASGRKRKGKGKAKGRGVKKPSSQPKVQNIPKNNNEGVLDSSTKITEMLHKSKGKAAPVSQKKQKVKDRKAQRKESFEKAKEKLEKITNDINNSLLDFEKKETQIKELCISKSNNHKVVAECLDVLFTNGKNFRNEIDYTQMADFIRLVWGDECIKPSKQSGGYVFKYKEATWGTHKTKAGDWGHGGAVSGFKQFIFDAFDQDNN